jgi:hypothetical protein
MPTTFIPGFSSPIEIVFFMGLAPIAGSLWKLFQYWGMTVFRKGGQGCFHAAKYPPAAKKVSGHGADKGPVRVLPVPQDVQGELRVGLGC